MATNRKKLNVILWAVQILLTLLYLFSGGAKLTLPIAVMTQQVHFPGLFAGSLVLARCLGRWVCFCPDPFVFGPT